MNRRRTRIAVAPVLLLLVALSSGCASVGDVAPHCDAQRRVGIVAQSLPAAAYVPCVRSLRPGWTSTNFQPRSGGTTFELVSDRDPGHPVRVRLRRDCEVGDATVTTPRADGARTYLRLRSVSPRYAGTLIDAFPGGCVTYTFDFARGPHVALVDDFENEVQLLARRELALVLRSRFGTEIDR